MTDPTRVPPTRHPDLTPNSNKLLSLLALAAGAAAIPQSGHADVIFTDLSTNNIVVGPAGLSSYTLGNFPGTNGVAFKAFHKATSVVPGGSSRWVNVSHVGYAKFQSHATGPQASFAWLWGPGRTWNQLNPPRSYKYAPVAAANSAGGRTPSSFDHQYILFKFRDSSLPGDPLRYGWIDVSGSNPTTGTTGPEITVWGYAYDDTGAVLASGSVPEPGPIALLALGALTLGAAGLRSWRRGRNAATPLG